MPQPWEIAGVSRASWLRALRAAAEDHLRATDVLRELSGRKDEHDQWLRQLQRCKEGTAEFDRVRAGEREAVLRWLPDDPAVG